MAFTALVVFMGCQCYTFGSGSCLPQGNNYVQTLRELIQIRNSSVLKQS